MSRKIKRVKRTTIDDFRASTSMFRHEEESALEINIISTNDSSKIFNPLFITGDTSQRLAEIVLPDFHEGSIKSYVPSENDKLVTSQRRFLIKLRQVLINNDPDSEAPNCERFIDDLMSFICDHAELDDGLQLTLRPCNLRLQVFTESFSAIADREGRRGMELTFIIQEDEHRRSSTYKHGDLQLACAMIAATQQNYQLLEEIYPPKMMGIKIVADCIYFCSMMPDKDYIEALYSGLPNSSQRVTMYKFPEDGFYLSNPAHRKQILQYMTCIRNEAISVKPKYVQNR